MKEIRGSCSLAETLERWNLETHQHGTQTTLICLMIIFVYLEKAEILSFCNLLRNT